MGVVARPQPAARPMTPSRPARGLAVLLLGEAGAGKTYTAGSLTDPQYCPWLFWNTDRPDGPDSLKVPAGCEVVDLSERLLTDPTVLLAALKAELAAPKLRYKTYCVDSLSFYQNYGIIVPKVAEVGSFHRVGFAGWGDIYIDMMQVLLELRALQSRGANVIAAEFA